MLMSYCELGVGCVGGWVGGRMCLPVQAEEVLAVTNKGEEEEEEVAHKGKEPGAFEWEIAWRERVGGWVGRKMEEEKVV